MSYVFVTYFWMNINNISCSSLFCVVNRSFWCVILFFKGNMDILCVNLFHILYPELSFPVSSTTPLSTLEKQSQNHMTIINVFQSHDQNIVVPAISHTELPVLATTLYGRLSYLLKAILYPELSFLLRYTTSLSTLILQDFCKILKQ